MTIERPRDEWSITDKPELRILDNVLWAKARARMERRKTKQQGGRKPTLFGGLLRCAHCGGAVVAVSQYLYGCAARKDRGTCPGVLAPRRDTDARLIEIIRDDLLSPEALADMRQQAADIAKTRRQEARHHEHQARQRTTELNAEIALLTDALAKIGYSDAIGARLRAAETELAKLAAPTTEPTQTVDLQVIVGNYRKMLENLDKALMDDTEVAREILRDLLGSPVVGQDDEGIWVEIETPLAQAAASGVDTFGSGGRI